jgi:HemY protein
MTRVLVFVLLVLAAALGLAWLADRPGTISMEWLGYRIETTAFVAAVAIAILVAALILIYAIVHYLLTRPAAVRAYVKERRKQQGYEALSRGLIAIGVGNRAEAQRFAGLAGRHLPSEPLTALLRAQTAQLKGDKKAARGAFESMLKDPETKLLGVRGLFLEAQRSNDLMAARALAEQAVNTDPKLGWGVNALFDMQARAGDWDGALKTLAIARQNGHVEAAVANRRRAVLLTAEARDLESNDPDKALTLANDALKLAPSLVPAAEIAGRILASRGETRHATRLIAKTWKLSPHPDLATVYAYARHGDSPRERLKRVKQLAGMTPDDIEGRIAVATAAIEAHDWQEARAALASDIDDRPSARICALMARIEAGEGDRGREREWLARAVRAPRDRAWIGEGYVSDRWLPVSPISGAVDVFAWKAPVDAIGRGDDTLLIEEHPLPAQDVSASQEAATIVEVGGGKDGRPETPRPKTAPPSGGKKPEPAVFVPARPPDDPGVAPTDTDESPASLERLRAAQIR